MFKFILCIYALSIALPAFAGISLAIMTPGRKLSFLRGLLAAVFSAIISFGFLLALLFMHFTPAGLLDFFRSSLSGDIIYQDVMYLALSGAAYCVVSIAAGFLIRRLVFEDTAGIGRLQENMVILSVLFSLAVVAGGCYISEYSKSHILITELHGDGSFKDAGGVFTTIDYITLENRGACPVDMNELYLSDNGNDLKKLSLEGNRIIPGQVLPFFLDDTSPFKLGNGETVYLSDKNGKVLSSVLYDPEAMIKFDAPVFSVESGFYPDEFMLELSLPSKEASGQEQADIYYTLDGSAPSVYSLKYEGPIRVYDRKGEDTPCLNAQRVVYDYEEYEPEFEDADRAFIIRAAAFDTEGNRSRTSDAVYFVGDTEYEDKKVISLTADYELLFGLNGICVTGPLYDAWYLNGREGEQPQVNFWLSGRASEIEGNLQFFDNGRHEGGQDVGLRVFGGSTRDLPLKHFSIYSRKAYSGSDSFSVDFFDTKRPVHSVALRDGTADAVLQELVSGRDVASQEHAEVSVFLNGEFWFDTFVCEKYSPEYFYEHKGIAENNLILVKEGEIDDGMPGDELLYQQIYAFIGEHDLGNPEAYEEFGNIIDVQSYIEYLCANIYGCNLDQDEQINRMLYRARTPVGGGDNDGRWRWALYDMDLLDRIFDTLDYYEVDEAAQINSFNARVTENSVNFEEQTLFKALMQNETFRMSFIDTFMEMMDEDFSYERVKPVLSKFGAGEEMEEFFLNRKEYMTQYIYEEFE
ncbi:MAG: CotH kinase family protein [Lachnospiraceae bacterium]|nr:CotH kinase family protein [Lachnospiraceae bacterium]